VALYALRRGAKNIHSGIEGALIATRECKVRKSKSAEVFFPESITASLYSSPSGLAFPSGNQGAFDSRMNIFGPPPESVEGHFWQDNLRTANPWNGATSLRRFGFPVIQYASHDEPWMLLLEHRTGRSEAIGDEHLAQELNDRQHGAAVAHGGHGFDRFHESASAKVGEATVGLRCIDFT